MRSATRLTCFGLKAKVMQVMGRHFLATGESKLIICYHVNGENDIVDMACMCHILKMATASTFPIKKLVNLTEDQASRISAYRFDGRIPSENEAIRRLIELGLEAAKQEVKP